MLKAIYFKRFTKYAYCAKIDIIKRGISLKLIALFNIRLRSKDNLRP
ncbi:hypothetical protein SAMN05444267_101513 [Chryseobacterium polytrichastri]|uniref:Uncharacterized protein n=1 Tax=Chryseobacterium polytrichastri TaxID=1302687 RepID=A0A1M6Z949_9FLAO|nr:hypothetical protein SAMN05444267_101513 [Chryseobacterium polytrichastri]